MTTSPSAPNASAFESGMSPLLTAAAYALVPGADMPSPMAHVRHRVHAVLAAALLNSPAAHVLHVRSELAVAMRLTYLPAAHGAEVTAQTAPSLLALNVAPTSQGAH